MGDRIFEALAHPLRRRALKLLGERPRMYSELMEELGVDSPTLAFHLKKLAGLVEKGGNGFYRLTDLGRKALEVMAVLEGAGQPQPRAEAEELTFSDRVVLKIGRCWSWRRERGGR
jgi:DNA-binding transcriptional ArsR family regulator